MLNFTNVQHHVGGCEWRVLELFLWFIHFAEWLFVFVLHKFEKNTFKNYFVECKNFVGAFCTKLWNPWLPNGAYKTDRPNEIHCKVASILCEWYDVPRAHPGWVSKSWCNTIRPAYSCRRDYTQLNSVVAGRLYGSLRVDCIWTVKLRYVELKRIKKENM